MSKKILFPMAVILIAGLSIACSGIQTVTATQIPTQTAPPPTEIVPTLQIPGVTPKPGDWISKRCSADENFKEKFQFNGIVYDFDGKTLTVSHHDHSWTSQDGDQEKLWGDSRDYLFKIYDKQNPGCSPDKPYGWEWIEISIPQKEG